MTGAVWASSGALVIASADALFALDSTCAEPRRVPAKVEALIAENGADRLVIEHDGAFELWDAAALRSVGSIDHPARGRGGAVSADGKRVALAGCKEVAADPKLVTSCGELYDGGSGGGTGSFVAKHAIEAVSFSRDARYLVARSDDRGLTVFDAASGKTLVARPRWSHAQDVHGWNRPDVAAITGDELVVSYDDAVEHVDLATGKTLGKLVTPGRTLAVYGERSKRAAVLQGAASRVRVWDVKRHAVVRTFELGKEIAPGANCRHCALEIDEADEDRIWLASNYTDDRLELRVASGEVKRVAEHTLRSDTPPGVDPSGRLLASLVRGELRVTDVERSATVCVAGARRP